MERPVDIEENAKGTNVENITHLDGAGHVYLANQKLRDYALYILYLEARLKRLEEASSVVVKEYKDPTYANYYTLESALRNLSNVEEDKMSGTTCVYTNVSGTNGPMGKCFKCGYINDAILDENEFCCRKCRKCGEVLFSVIHDDEEYDDEEEW